MSMIHEKKLLDVLLAPHVSEKATMVAEQNRQVIFKVAKNADKHTVKLAVEKLFNVEVESVNICNVKGKQRNFRQVAGKRADWKKAYVCLKEGHDIDFVGKE